MQIKNNILHFDRDKSADASKSSNNLQSNAGNHNSMIPEGPLKDIINHTSQWCSNAIAALFDNVDTQLFEMAEKSERATEQNIYFDAMRIVRLRRNQAHEAFKNNIDLAFNPSSITQTQQPQNKVSSDINNLSLLNDDNLEEDLATHAMVAKAERDNRDLLLHLNQRMAYVYQGMDIQNENNPLGPTAICKAFSEAVETLDADIKVKLLVFKLFDINVVTKLKQLYENVNKLLINRGILPDLRITYKQSGEQKSSRPADLNVSRGLPINTPVSDLSQTDSMAPVDPYSYDQQSDYTAASYNDSETYQLLQQIVAQNKLNLQSNMPNQAMTDFASTNDIMNTLQQMQSNTLNLNAASQIANSSLLKETLRQTLQANNYHQAINHQDDDLIDIIGMLFDFILNDENLVDSVKSLISRLQIPLIKIALQDKSFFSNKTHPARKFLNDLANIGLGVTDELPSRENPLYLKLEYLVNRILNEMTDGSDSSLFVEILDDLERFNIQFNQGRKDYKATSKSAAVKLVKTELDARLADKQIPYTITLLLERVWQDVMIDIFFNEGMKSDEWDMAMTFIDTLIWSIDPKVDIQSQKQLVRVIPGILNALNAGLDRIQYPRDLREQLLQDLQNCHLACMKGQSIDENMLSDDESAYISNKINKPQQLSDAQQPAGSLQPDAQQPAGSLQPSAEPESAFEIAVDDLLFEKDLDNLEALDEEELLASLEDGSEQAIADQGEDELIEDEFCQQARSLSTGSWIDFYGPENVTHRAKISWMSEDSSAFIFVTQTGQIAEKSLAGLSAALRSQQAKILDKSPVFERALDAVLESLQ